MKADEVSRPLSFAEAVTTILDHSLHGQRVVTVPISEAAGWVLAEEFRADLDMPTFQRAAMDGFAFRHSDSEGRDAFRIVDTVAAGDLKQVRLGQGECVRIMTGAPVPDDADTVIPVEETHASGDTVRFRSIPSRGSHIAPRGQDVHEGQVVLQDGCVLRPQEIAILASVGRRSVPVYAGPSIAFAATGDELVEPGEPLRPGCIRNANAYSLWSQILTARATPHYLGILRDRPEPLREKIAEGLEHDFLILSGGVSMGEFDLVPQVLEELDVRILFRRLLVRPGQPTVFGVHETEGRRTLVFGLPGNPISTLLSFDQYVAPAVRVFRGHPQPLVPVQQGELTQTVRKRAGFLTLIPCISRWSDRRYRLDPLRFHGSADIYAITGADAVAYLPVGVEEALAGTIVDFRKMYQP